MEVNLLDVFILVLTLTFILYKLSTRNFDYWKKRGIPYAKPLPFVGNFLDVFLFRSTIGHYLAKLYNEFQTPYFGIFILNKPHLIIRNTDLIKSILVKDFNYFIDRTIHCDKKCDELSANVLFIVKNPEWKALRVKMSPTFTSGKIKNMLPLINEAATEMNIYLDKYAHLNFVEAKEICSKYATDVIASCAFGITANCFKYENAQFREVGRKMFAFNWKNSFRQTSYFVAPSIVQLFRLSFFEKSVTDFLKDVFWRTIEERKESQVHRNDFIDIIIQMMKQEISSDGIKFEGNLVVSQVAQFFVAGFETTSTTMAFTLYELCLQPKIQNKLRLEIKEMISEHGGLTYEAVQNMKYLHMVICETLRKYPVLPFLDRVCNADYKIPNSDHVIEKGTPVYIPMFGLHYDPTYFPDPNKYDPERFSDENKASLPSYSYIPFGDGPRNCIGERFGLLVGKVGLAQILLKYELEAAAETPVPLKFETKSFLLASTVGLPMKFKQIVSDVVDINQIW